MQITTIHDSADWQAGAFYGTWLNTDLYASPVTGYPALVPLSAGTIVPVVYDGGTLISGSVATPGGGNAWTVHNRYLTTDQAGDTLTFAPPSDTLYLDIVTTGALYPNMVDSRGHAWLAYADGDAGQSAADGNLYVEQLRHGPVIRITVDGTQVAQVDTAAGLLSTRIVLDGLSGHTVVLTNTGAVTAPTADVHRLTVVGSVVTAGSGGGAGVRLWISPLYDAGDELATWIGADWEQAGPGTVTHVAFLAGQTPAIDGTWQVFGPAVVETVPGGAGVPVPFTQEGVPHGRAGFLAPLGTIVRARYAQAQLTLIDALPVPTANGSTVPWVRALELYSSLPETETLTLLRLPPLLRGPLLTGLESARGAMLAKLHADAQELVQSYAIGTARGRWLQQYGRDLGLPQAPGEGQAAYAARLQAALAGKATGPAAQFVAAQLSAYIGNTCTITAYGASGTPWAYTITVPPDWPAPVSRAQINAFAASINPAGHLQTLSYSS